MSLAVRVALAIVAGFVLLAILGHFRLGHRRKALIARRDGLHPSALIDFLVQDAIPEDIAEFVWDALSPYYDDGDLLPHPDDELVSDAYIDPDDIEDIVAHFFKCFGLAEPSIKKPEMVPTHMTVRSFAHYLDAKRYHNEAAARSLKGGSA